MTVKQVQITTSKLILQDFKFFSFITDNAQILRAVWNSLPETVVTAPTIDIFKSLLMKLELPIV